MTQRYSQCPRQPEGYKWFAYASGSFAGGGGASCGFGFDKFSQALAYLRKRHAGTVRDWWCYVDGPGGRMDCNTIAALVEVHS